MRRFFLSFVIVCCLSGFAAAQTVDMDTFEAYADTAAMNAVWSTISGSWEATPRELMPTGGAGGSSKYMQLRDGGYSFLVAAPTIITPAAAGTYKITFFYQNGNGDGYLNPMSPLKVTATQGATVVGQVTLPATATSGWTAAETAVNAMAATAIKLEISANTPSAVKCSAAFDEFKLVAAAMPLTLDVFPTEAVVLSTTETLTATCGGGTPPYTVSFDVDNDGTVDGTDTTEPYEFSFDTFSKILDTTGTAVVKISVADSAAGSAEVINTYEIDNRGGGRVKLFTNTDFATFTGNLPNGWVEYMVGTGVTYGSGSSYSTAANPALTITFPAIDYTNRYTLRTVGVQGYYADLQTWYWGIGSTNRMFYQISDDDVTYTNTQVEAAAVNNSGWLRAVGNKANLGLESGIKYVSIAPHMFAAETCSWDDVTVKGTTLPAVTAAESWNLYE